MNHNPTDYESIEAFLHSLDGYVVLRNHDFKSNLGAGGDVDILAGNMVDARKAMFEKLGKPWWIMRRTYVEGCFYSWGHIDLTPKMEWHGATYIENNIIFKESSISSFGFRQPRLAHEALICWFASLIWGGFFKDRYAPVLMKAAEEDTDAFSACLNYAVGKKWGRKLLVLAQEGTPEKSASWVKPLRRALWIRGFKRQPVSTCKGWLAFWLREVQMRLHPPVPWVAILGIDGSGKSTVIEGIRQQWESIGLKVMFPHWRPECIRPGKSEGPVTKPHSKPPRGFAESVAKLAFLLVDWSFGFRIRLADKRARGWFVIFDRCYHDLLVDPHRYRYGAPKCLASLIFCLFPKPEAVILLDAPADVLHARKPETTLEMARALRDDYLNLVVNHPVGFVVDCNRPIELVIDDIRKILVRVTHDYSKNH
jgi:thymidylate kinase